MSGGSVIVSELRAALAPHGVFIRGIISFDEGEGPLLADGMPARSVILLGNIGGSIWEPFSRWRQASENSGHTDPLDEWSKAIIKPLASAFEATAYFPSDPPWQPFQRWAMQAEGLKASPLGILIHPDYGLWHGYRGALGFAGTIEEDGPGRIAAHPCDHCAEKPCLTACPVDAITSVGFDVAACRSHLQTDAGKTGCMIGGCLARNACPVGSAYRYSPAQLAFHMAALRS
ncbi:4Fe-4S dicluster domain-containing protein [Rhizobium sp. CB3090]|uniref:4Fe-4S dicluster domain-containing protein n=1 Tax=Rhizobium sp. CB3090 TaxID=3039156 RepID=UPI0024B1F902|nr:4Fe-4S dicluster domain-containing protein [Rhizobium sp. CB3090]WFU10871.1 4Fe-4S dicluster domain-containing protein [Rhizobium sp. CB3090]